METWNTLPFVTLQVGALLRNLNDHPLLLLTRKDLRLPGFTNERKRRLYRDKKGSDSPTRFPSSLYLPSRKFSFFSAFRTFLSLTIRISTGSTVFTFCGKRFDNISFSKLGHVIDGDYLPLILHIIVL